MDQCFGQTSEVESRDIFKDAQSKRIATRVCRTRGGIKTSNNCVNQKYIKTIKNQISGKIICIDIYQCAGYAWTCTDGYQGEILDE